MPEKKTRRLAAIMFTDIQGYTALMQQSEAEALRVREVHREIFNRSTEQFHGEIIQYYGDGTLSIFESAVDAVQCGIAMQYAFQQESQIPVRIGIHAGDIVLTEDDIIGDAVNIASRVESLAVPGGVLISDKVFDEIRNKETIQTTSLGKFKFKNVKHPVGVYAISNEGLAVPSKRTITGKLEKEKKVNWQFILGFVVGLLFLSIWGYRSLQTEPLDVPMAQSIVVLPFDNFTGQTDLDYFIQGMHASLIGDLGQISALRVISPTTARAYKNSGKSIPEIAAELNVDAVMEVSVHCLGDSICIIPKLLTVEPEERQIWAQKYNEEKSQVLNLYQSLTKAISQQINVTLTPEEESRMAETRTVDTVAYALYLRGQFYLDQINPSSLNSAFQYFERATEIAPDWGDPYAGLAMVVAYQAQMSILPPSEAVPEIHRYLNIALDLAPNSADAYLAKAIAAVWSEWDWEKGEAAFLKSLELDPNNALCRMFYAHLLGILRQNEEALQQASIAHDLDPLRTFLLGLHGAVLLQTGQCETAVTPLEKALAIEPDHSFAQSVLINVLACTGNYERAFEMQRERFHDLWESYGVTERYEKAFYEQGWKAFVEEDNKIHEEVFAKDSRRNIYGQAGRYVGVEEYDQAMMLGEKGYFLHDANLPYLSTSRIYDQMKDRPDYIALLKKMNLPVD